MQFRDVVETSSAIAATSRRLTKIELLAGLLRQLRGEEIEVAVAFLSGEPRQGKLGVGYRTVQQARTAAALEATLSIADVDQALEALARARAGSAKLESLALLLLRATGAEQEFLARLLTGELRQGALEGIMTEGIARAAQIDPERVRRAIMLAGSIAPLARAALEQGAPGLDRFEVQLFRPVQPMLAQTAGDTAEALLELGDAALEYKMDGARVQVHRDGDEVRVYSRALNEVTGAVPEIVELARALPGKSAILDGEVIALQPDGRPHPFQVTMRRFGRKLDVENLRAELPLTPFFFDLLYLDGQPLLEEPQSERFGALGGLLPQRAVMPNLRTADPERAAEFVRNSLAAGHEGAMAKATGSAYSAGARGQSWLKIKQARSLDLVILAAEWGSGRRRGWLSNLHLGARDVVKGGFAMLGKTFKGLTDEMLAWQTAELQRLEISRDNWTVYVEPKLVVEIAFNEIQVSPRHESGLALRFARVKRYRTDKSAAESDTFQTVQRMAGINA